MISIKCMARVSHNNKLCQCSQNRSVGKLCDIHDNLHHECPTPCKVKNGEPFGLFYGTIDDPYQYRDKKCIRAFGLLLSSEICSRIWNDIKSNRIDSYQNTNNKIQNIRCKNGQVRKKILKWLNIESNTDTIDIDIKLIESNTDTNTANNDNTNTNTDDTNDTIYDSIKKQQLIRDTKKTKLLKEGIIYTMLNNTNDLQIDESIIISNNIVYIRNDCRRIGESSIVTNENDDFTITIYNNYICKFKHQVWLFNDFHHIFEPS